MEITKEPGFVQAEVKKNRKSREWWHKFVIGIAITLACGAVMLGCYLWFNARIDTDGLITILIVAVFGMVFSISFVDRIGL